GVSPGGGPNGIAFANGDLFVTDSVFGGVIRVNPVVANLPPGHNQTEAWFGSFLGTPTGIAIAANGDLFVVDPQCCGLGIPGVVRVNPANGSQTVVSSGQHFQSPSGIAIAASGDLLVADASAGAVIRVNPKLPSDNQTVVTDVIDGPFGI